MYPLDIKNCAKGPSQGGLPIAKLKEFAKGMGIDVKGLKKDNRLTQVPKELGNLENLHTLTMDKKIKEFPPELRIDLALARDPYSFYKHRKA